MDDAMADILQAKGLLSSPRRLAAAASRGIDFGDLTDEQVADYGLRVEKARAKAEELNKRLGLDLVWRDVLSWPMPQGMQVSVSYGPASQAGRIIANETHSVGSVCINGVVRDSTGMATMEGVKFHVVRAGAVKDTGLPDTLIPDETLARTGLTDLSRIRSVAIRILAVPRRHPGAPSN